ncbi:MAG: hypothetical protein N2114_02125 [Candidatus Goldbacteria bacterium]|nr:hypothetical protein [Candidatus Goldiibacteriota bacterium]
MENGIEKINPVNKNMDVKISGENIIKSQKSIKGKKTTTFTEIFKKKIEKTYEKKENKYHAKYKNGKRIK